MQQLITGDNLFSMVKNMVIEVLDPYLGRLQNQKLTNPVSIHGDPESSRGAEICNNIQVSGGRYFRPGMVALPQDSLNVPQNAKPTTNGNHSKGHAGEVRSAENGRVGSIYQEQIEPCHLSSSIYYGGQDIYIQSCSDQDSGLNDDSEGDQSGLISLFFVFLLFLLDLSIIESSLANLRAYQG
ncbi:hypothetical protein CXB51_028176 [Gossypium anomalum]|uniref:Uncharacterized protein n=1 Tax=Gossypium anomalum TaxID=47600 RepID=A0A8J5YGM5_9ROSI|nr:hypothetical protein CXB51_028176 [Gossypium anomalum]